MHTKHLSGFIFTSNAQSQILEIQGCTRSKLDKELNAQNGLNI